MLFSADVLLVFFLSVFFTTTGQLLQKKASLNHSKTQGDNVLHHILSPDVILSILFLGLGLLFWLMVLTKVDLSLAYPLLSINYIVILLGARYMFNEAIPKHRWLGVVVILLGISILVRA